MESAEGRGGRSANKFRKSQIRKFADLKGFENNGPPLQMCQFVHGFAICRPNLFKFGDLRFVDPNF